MPAANGSAAGGTAAGSATATATGCANYTTLRAAVVEAIKANEAVTFGMSTAEPWRSIAWEFTRALRGHPELVDLDADDAADAIEAVFLDLGDALPYAEWYREEGGLIDLRGFGSPWYAALGAHDSCCNEADPQEDFLRLWDRVDPDGSLPAAVARARRREASRPAGHYGADLAHPRRAPLRLFLALVEELAKVAEGEAFPLAVEPLAKALGVDRKTIGGWLQNAVDRGFLVRVTEASRQQRRAACYRLAEVQPW